MSAIRIRGRPQSVLGCCSRDLDESRGRLGDNIVSQNIEMLGLTSGMRLYWWKITHCRSKIVTGVKTSKNPLKIDNFWKFHFFTLSLMGDMEVEISKICSPPLNVIIVLGSLSNPLSYVCVGISSIAPTGIEPFVHPHMNFWVPRDYEYCCHSSGLGSRWLWGVWPSYRHQNGGNLT